MLSISSYWRRMVVGCVSFDCHPGSPFFSHRRCMLLSRLCLILSTRLALSPQKLGHSCSDNNTRSLSPQKVTRSIGSPPTCPVCHRQLRAPRIALNFSPQKAGAAAGRLAACARRRKGPEQTSTAPSSMLSPRPRRCLRSSSSAALTS
jgi:hypothetical protein